MRRPRLAAVLPTLVSGLAGPGPVILPGWGHSVQHATHRSVVVVDIVESTSPIRRTGDKVIIRGAMYNALFGAFKWHDLLKCYCEDRGDGAFLLVPPSVPKDWLVTRLPERLETAIARHNGAMADRDPERAAATQFRLRVAVNAGEVMFDRYGVVGQAIDHTFRLVEAPPLKEAFGRSRDACGLIVSDVLYEDVVFQHADARPDRYEHVNGQVKQTVISAWMRVPVPVPPPREWPLVQQDQQQDQHQHQDQDQLPSRGLVDSRL